MKMCAKQTQRCVEVGTAQISLNLTKWSVHVMKTTESREHSAKVSLPFPLKTMQCKLAPVIFSASEHCCTKCKKSHQIKSGPNFWSLNLQFLDVVAECRRNWLPALSTHQRWRTCRSHANGSFLLQKVNSTDIFGNWFSTITNVTQTRNETSVSCCLFSTNLTRNLQSREQNTSAVDDDWCEVRRRAFVWCRPVADSLWWTAVWTLLQWQCQWSRFRLPWASVHHRVAP